MAALWVRLAIPVLAILVATTAVANENLVVNGGFEELNESTGLPLGWTTTVYDQSTVQFSVDRKVPRTGGASVSVVGFHNDLAPRGPRASISQYVSVAPGELYSLRAWYRTRDMTDPGSVEIRLTFRDSSNQVLQIARDFSFEVLTPAPPYHRYEGGHLLHIFPRSPVENEWGQIQAKLRAPENAVRMHLELFLWEQTGTLWWDDVELIRAEEGRPKCRC